MSSTTAIWISAISVGVLRVFHAPVLVCLGYALATLGFFVISALRSGSFEALGLHKKSELVIAGIALFLGSTIFINIAIWLGKQGKMDTAFFITIPGYLALLFFAARRRPNIAITWFWISTLALGVGHFIAK